MVQAKLTADGIGMTAILGDIGATHARFAIFDGTTIGAATVLDVRGFATPVEAIGHFLAAASPATKPQNAVIAAAGALVGQRIAMTNAPWVVDGELIRAAFTLSNVAVLNDFEALARSLPALGAGDVRRIGGGAPLPAAPLAVLGPGTGFGVAGFIPGGAEETVLVTEGGHATLAGDTARDDAVIAFLRQRFAHVSIERALCGDGLAALCEAVIAVDRTPPALGRAAPEIVQHALGGDCAVCVAALDLFCELLGTVAGNVALTLGARGGVYIGGGMVPRFVDFLARSRFRERFEGKGRLAPYLAAIPTAVIVHPQPAFLGLARLAQRLADAAAGR